MSLVGALAFLCYLSAELLGLSGILALFFCGMAVSHYALQHVSRPSAAALLNAFRTLSYLIEGFIFLYVGRDALDPVKWAAASFFQTLYMLVVVSLLVALSRAAFVFPCGPPQRLPPPTSSLSPRAACLHRCHKPAIAHRQHEVQPELHHLSRSGKSFAQPTGRNSAAVVPWPYGTQVMHFAFSALFKAAAPSILRPAPTRLHICEPASMPRSHA